MSLGIAALRSLVTREAARLFPEAEIEIVETHHSRKADAPSGTARMLAAAVQKERPEAALVCGRSGFSPRKHSEIGISSIRLGSVTGIHEVLISTGAETLSLKHEAHDRRLFAEGALRAAVFLCGRQPGLYDMDDLLPETPYENSKISWHVSCRRSPLPAGKAHRIGRPGAALCRGLRPGKALCGGQKGDGSAV